MRLKRFAAFVFCLLASVEGKAALHDRGGGLIYDDVLNITWLQDANLALTTGHPPATSDSLVPGYMTWQHSLEWVGDLSYFDSVRNITLTNWRLPKIFDPAAGQIDCLSGPSSTFCSFGPNNLDPNTGELAHLFYATLGNVWDGGVANSGPFLNMFEGDYWYGDAFPPDSAWDFATTNGAQGATALDGGVHYAWAVMDGDVAAVPIPAAFPLFGSCLLVFGLLVWRRQGHRVAER